MNNTDIRIENIDIKEIENIVNYHDEIFSVHKDISDVLYLEIKQEMFTMINLFSLLEANFEDRLINSLLKDILSLIYYFDRVDELLVKDNEKEKLIKFRTLKKKIIPIINTKMFYLDLYIYKKIENSRFIQSYLKEKYTYIIKNTIEFVAFNEDEFSTLINVNYKVEELDLKVKYDKESVRILFSLDTYEDRREDFLLRKLIDSKNSILFFKGMPAEDIKYVVKDVEFIKYKTNETLIIKDEDSKEVYFLLSGKCNVVVGNSIVARIGKNQLFGEFSSILNEKRNATIIANQESTVLRFKFAFELFNKEPYPFTMLYKNIMDELIKKIVNSNTKR